MGSGRDIHQRKAEIEAAKAAKAAAKAAKRAVRLATKAAREECGDRDGEVVVPAAEKAPIQDAIDVVPAPAVASV
jgi:hypothetical protein